VGMEVSKKPWEWKSRRSRGNGSLEEAMGMEVSKKPWEWKSRRSYGR
jgi:hypothetical protein